jgi:hypothetical protein
MILILLDSMKSSSINIGHTIKVFLTSALMLLKGAILHGIYKKIHQGIKRKPVHRSFSF